MRVHTEIVIDVDTALAMYDDSFDHAAEYTAPSASGEGELIFDNLVFIVERRVAPPKRLRAKMFPNR
jgi:hypothetical protein